MRCTIHHTHIGTTMKQTASDQLHAVPRQILCYCGEPAIIAIHFPATNSPWIPQCHNCYREHLDNAQEVNDHEMSNFGGSYGLVSWDEKDIKGAIQGRDHHVTWVD